MSEPVANATDRVSRLHFQLGIVGLGLLRGSLEPPVAAARTDELRALLTELDAEEPSSRITPIEHDAETGYARWASVYDNPGNPLIDAEEPVVRQIFAGLPIGSALDAACGTGRHARHLADRGWNVIGVDATPAMLDVARAKVPEAEFHRGHLLSLPLADDSVDLVVCSLALTHVEDLSGAIRELTRVTRPGGDLVLSDLHPTSTWLGGAARFATAEPSEQRYVVNLAHQISTYLAAFRELGLEVVDCVEPSIDDQVDNMVAPALVPALRQGATGCPWVLIWHLRRPSSPSRRTSS
jgi:SAM-dependent methyltransferase